MNDVKDKIHKNDHHEFFKSIKYTSISTKLILLFFLVSLFITTITSFIQIYGEYNKELKNLENDLVQVEKSYLSSIAVTIWNVDKEKLKLELEGILKFPGFEEITFTGLDPTGLNMTIGKVTSHQYFSKKMNIIFLDTLANDKKNMGELKITVGLDPLHNNLFSLALEILLIEFLKTLLISILFFLIFQNIVIKHLKNITAYTKNISNIESLKVKLQLDRSDNIVDEFSFIVASTNSLADRIYHYTNNLHLLIDEKTKNIKYILDNIKQGIFTILPNNKIHPEYSKYLETILETKNIAGHDVMDLVFKDTNLSPETLSKLFSALVSSLGEESINFEINYDAFIKEMKIECKSGLIKTVELEWMPILGKKKIIEKIMVTIRNVTELRKLQYEAEKREREIEVMGEILSNSPEKFQQFIKQVNLILVESKTYLKNIQKKKDSTPQNILFETITKMRNYFLALKSLFRSYNLFSLFASIVNIETEIEHLSKSILSRHDGTSPNLSQNTFEYVIVELLKYHKKIDDIIEDYIDLNSRKMRRISNERPLISKNQENSNTDLKAGSRLEIEEIQSETVMTSDFQHDVEDSTFYSYDRVAIDHSKVQKQIKILRSLPLTNLNPTQKSILHQTYQFLTLIGSDSIKNVLKINFVLLSTLGKALNKLPPKIVIKDPGIYIKSILHPHLLSITTHLFRNSMDHGIEHSSEREMKGKEPFGQIDFDLFMKEDKFLIRYKDDGRGLNIDLIKQVAIEKKYIPPSSNPPLEDLCKLIFLPGFSTAKKLSEISGRGIGMDATKKITEDLGGTIQIVLATAPIKDPRHQPFEIIFSFPKDYIIVKSEI